MRGGVRASFTAYGGLFRDRTFVGLALVAGLTMAAVFGYVAGSPFVMQERYGLSVQHFGLEFGAGSFFLIAGTQLTPRLAARWTSAQVLGATLIVGTAAAGAMVVTAATGFGGLVGLLGATQFGVAGLVGPVFGVLGVSAVTMAAVITGALALSRTVYLLVVQPWRLDPMDHETVPVARAPTHREPWPNSTHPTGR